MESVVAAVKIVQLLMNKAKSRRKQLDKTVIAKSRNRVLRMFGTEQVCQILCALMLWPATRRKMDACVIGSSGVFQER